MNHEAALANLHFKMKPVIAIDIDDVLIDTVTALFGYYNQTYGTRLAKTHYYSKDPVVHGVQDFAEAVKRFENYLSSKAFERLAPIQQAVISVKRLSRFYDFVAITSRPAFMQAMTEAWLNKYFRNIQGVRFTHFILAVDKPSVGKRLTKVDVCKEINARYMIEDHLHHAIPVAAAGVRVFLIDQPWNQTNELPDNIERVMDWQSIEKLLGDKHV